MKRFEFIHCKSNALKQEQRELSQRELPLLAFGRVFLLTFGSLPGRTCRNELQYGSVNAIPLVRRGVEALASENMTQVPIASGALTLFSGNPSANQRQLLRSWPSLGRKRRAIRTWNRIFPWKKTIRCRNPRKNKYPPHDA